MSSLWTPDGEKPVERAGEPAPEELTEEELAERLEALREQLAQTPVDQVIAQSAYQFFEIGALHLSVIPPQLDQAKLAIDAFVESARHYVGAYLVVLGGCDVIAFTGGIGENAIQVREAICRNLIFAGIVLDPAKNQVRGKETKISAVESNCEIWTIPTNEELIVARQTEAVLNAN